MNTLKEVNEYVENIKEKRWKYLFHRFFWFHQFTEGNKKFQDEGYVYKVVHCDCGQLNVAVSNKLSDKAVTMAGG